MPPKPSPAHARSCQVCPLKQHYAAVQTQYRTRCSVTCCCKHRAQGPYCCWSCSCARCCLQVRVAVLQCSCLSAQLLHLLLCSCRCVLVHILLKQCPKAPTAAAAGPAAAPPVALGVHCVAAVLQLLLAAAAAPCSPPAAWRVHTTGSGHTTDAAAATQESHPDSSSSSRHSRTQHSRANPA
jgi:hypothetical protein